MKSIGFSALLVSLIVFSVSSTTIASGADSKSRAALDTVTVQADAVALSGMPSTTIESTLNNQIKWSDVYQNWKLDSLKANLPACVTPVADKDRAYIFHVVHWRIEDTGKPPQLVSSSWSAYESEYAKNPDVMNRRLDSTGNPLIYGKKRILLIGVDVFDNGKNGASALTIRYKSSVTQGTAENVQALGQVVSSLAGLAGAAKAAQGSILIAFVCQEGTAHLPFDANIVETIGVPKTTGNTNQNQSTESDPAPVQTPPATPPAPDDSKSPGGSISLNGSRTSSPHVSYVQLKSESPQSTGLPGLQDSSSGRTQNSNVTPSDRSSQTGSGNGGQQGGSPQDNTNSTSQTKASAQTPQSGQADCSGLSSSNNCTISRTLTSLDKEWWDVSLAQTVVGVKESKFSISGMSLISKPTTHNDLYAFFDVYPWAKWVTKDSGIPHFNAGLPVAGQTLYRPAFGISENVTGWTHLERLGFPVKMGLFVNLVNMKITRVVGTPTTAAQLATDSKTGRVWKPIYGIEVPVSALISKVGKGNQNKSATGGKGGTAGNSVNQGSTATQ